MRRKPNLEKRTRQIILWSALAGIVIAAGLYVGLSGILTPRAVPVETTPLPSEPESSASTPVVATPVGNTIGSLAPDFSLPTFDGETVSLSDYRGQVIILDFWASWCTPCRSSMPILHALWQRYRDRGVVLVGVSLDRNEADARAYLASNGFTDMVALWGSLSAADRVATTYGVQGIPHTFIIDRSGVIRFANHPGYLSASTIEALL
jgi:peroxiredoxin